MLLNSFLVRKIPENGTLAFFFFSKYLFPDLLLYFCISTVVFLFSFHLPVLWLLHHVGSFDSMALILASPTFFTRTRKHILKNAEYRHSNTTQCVHTWKRILPQLRELAVCARTRPQSSAALRHARCIKGPAPGYRWQICREVQSLLPSSPCSFYCNAVQPMEWKM